MNKSYIDWELTLNNIARCLQRPKDRLPIGITTDPKQSLSSSLHSLQMGTNSSSPVEAEPLVIAIKSWLQMYDGNKYVLGI